MTKTRAEDTDEEEAGIGTTTGGATMHLTNDNDNELPPKVANVSREELGKYMQCKRVGNYMLGKTVGEGSFAKVKEAFHILTGEKVGNVWLLSGNRPSIPLTGLSRGQRLNAASLSDLSSSLVLADMTRQLMRFSFLKSCCVYIYVRRKISVGLSKGVFFGGG